MEKDLVFYPYKQIGKSALEENAFSQCINVINDRELASVNYASELLSLDSDISFTWTMTTPFSFITLSGVNNWATGTPIQFTTTGTLPTGLSLATTYFLRKTGALTYAIYPTFLDAQNNTNIVVTIDGGSGTHTATKVALTKIMGIDGSYLLDDSGNLWQKDSAYTTLRLLSKGSGMGFGLKRYGNYLYLFREELDRYQIITGVLSASWQSDQITSSILSIDDNTLYLVHANEVASYNGTTYNSSALDLPTNVNISAISELGTYLVLGTDQNKLYLWDKNFDTYESPISFPDSTKMLISANNVVYVVLESGDIYVTNGTTSAIFREFPRHILSNKENPDFIFSPAGFRINNNSLLIGFGSTSNVFPIGIYEIDLKTADIRIAHISSTGNVGGDDTRVEITAIRPLGTFYFGWQTYNSTDGYAYGLDTISTDTRYTSAIVYSPFYKIGTKRNPRTLRHFEISLGEKLRTSQSVILSYRTDLSGSFETIGTLNEVSTISKVLDKAITCENLQYKLEITTNGDFTPYVREVRAYD